MKFLCLDCHAAMEFAARQEPGDGTFGAAFTCPTCGRSIALLANPMETQLVSSLGVKIGGRTLDQAPLELVRSKLLGKDGAFADQPDGGQPAAEAPGADPAGGPRELEASAGRPAPPAWNAEAKARLERVPSFVRGMVKKLYADYARERGIPEITPEIMDRARAELGLEGM
jgi:hypothetical protein